MSDLAHHLQEADQRLDGAQSILANTILGVFDENVGLENAVRVIGRARQHIAVALAELNMARVK